jgi:starch synthase
VQQPIHVIPYPVDTNQFCPGPKPLRPVVLAVGRVEKRKGADTLLRALPRVAARFPDCDFVFAGRVSADMIEMVRDAPQQAKFLGWLPREELVRWYQRATIVTAPSVWDNSPNTVYEAMSCSTPVIASRVGGIPELVDDGLTGLLTPPEDAEALAEAILTLLLDSARRDAMGRAGREKAMRQYAVSTVLHKTLSIYEQTLAGGAVADNR